MGAFAPRSRKPLPYLALATFAAAAFRAARASVRALRAVRVATRCPATASASFAHPAHHDSELAVSRAVA